MAATTTLLDLVTPTQGTLSGTWGDTVNYGITDYLDIAIAGTLTFTGDGAVTLTNTIGSASGNNIGSTTGQYMVIRVTGTLTTAKIITAPSRSKLYMVDNSATGSTVSFIRAGQTPAVSIAVGEKAFVYYNGTDYVKVASSVADGVTTIDFGSTGLTPATATSGAVTVAGTLAPANGGTGVSNNAAMTVTGSGNFAYTRTLTGATNVTFPTTGTLSTLAGSETLTNKTINGSNNTVTNISLTTGVTGILPIANGGTATATPALVQGTGVTITGTWPNQTINATGTGGTVTSVAGTGTVNGISLSGSVTTSGSLTLGGALSNVSLSSQVTGTLPVANGGTGLTAGTSGGILAYTASGTLASSAALAANNVVVGGGAGAAPSSTNLLAISAAVTTGNYIKAIGYADTVTALGNTGVAINLDVTSGNVFTATLNGNATITFRYPVSSGSSSFTLILTNDATPGRTVAWAGGTILFPGGAASLSRTTTANSVDVWFFFTPNGGTTWYGTIPMKNLIA